MLFVLHSVYIRPLGNTMNYTHWLRPKFWGAMLSWSRKLPIKRPSGAKNEEVFDYQGLALVKEIPVEKRWWVCFNSSPDPAITSEEHTYHEWKTAYEEWQRIGYPQSIHFIMVFPVAANNIGVIAWYCHFLNTQSFMAWNWALLSYRR